jgi:hypothetical protein
MLIIYINLEKLYNKIIESDIYKNYTKSDDDDDDDTKNKDLHE